MATEPTSSSDGDEFAEDLRLAAEGNADARDRLFAKHYEMFRQCATAWVTKHWGRRGPEYEISLGGTDIVNAAYTRLHDRIEAMEGGRAWFFRCFYTECLRIAVDHWRKTKRDKGRAERKRADIDPDLVGDPRMNADFDRLYDAIEELTRHDRRVGQVAMLKVLDTRPDDANPRAVRSHTNQEIADLLGIGLRTVEKDWAFAKAFLSKNMSDGKSERR